MDPELSTLMRELWSRALELRDLHRSRSNLKIAEGLRGFNDLVARLRELDESRGGDGADQSILELISGCRPTSAIGELIALTAQERASVYWACEIFGKSA